MDLFHVCNEEAAPRILAEGLWRGSFLTSSPAVAAYYAELIEEEGGTACVLALTLDAVLQAVGEAGVAPDRPSIAEPITTALGRTEAAVIADWTKSAGTWRDSLEIVASIMVTRPIPGHLLQRTGPAIPRP